MKHYVSLSYILIVMAALITGCHPIDNSIGRSMGRWKDFGLESMIQNRQSGVEYIEVTMNDLIGKDTAGVRDRASMLKARIDSSGLKVWSVHLPFSRKIDISLTDSVKRADVVSYISDMIRVAGVFQPRYLVLHPSSEPIAPDERADRLAYSRTSIGHLAPVAKEIGAALCIENLPRTCLGQNGQEMMYMLGDNENVGLCFDVNHLIYQSHQDFLKAVDKDRIMTVHLSDYDFADERHLLPGVGKIDWKPLWDDIRSHGYKGIFMFECYAQDEELVHARDILTGAFVPEKSSIDADSLAFSNAEWKITDLGRGAKALYAQVPMFYSVQSICCIKYPAGLFKSEILHRPGQEAGTVSSLAKKNSAAIAVNAAYFHVKSRTPSVYFRIGENVYGTTHPTETYRVDGVVGFRDKEGREMVIEYSDTTQYQSVTEGWHTVLATGPMLVKDGEVMVPLLKGGSADGANIAAMKEEQRVGSAIRTHYSSAQFYDKRHPRAAVGTDDEGNIYYVVIDGRFDGLGDGASIYETAYICKMLGMMDAINLDGGGSISLWSEKTGVISHPHGNRKWDNDGEREVPNLIVAY